MPQTYTLYLRGPGFEANAFEPAMASTRAELAARIDDLFRRHPACESVDVYFGSEELFRVRRPSHPA